MGELALRYGANPHQQGARLTASGALPITVLNGAPGYVNLLDALNAWQLVREARAATGLPAATSFKHVSPAGAALGLPLSTTERTVFAAGAGDLSPLAAAYARARGADRMSSYGDWVAVSDEVDLPTARLLRRETSDGIIAPGYAAAALELLRAKQGGAYRVVAIDPAFEPPERERREVFGLTLEQPRNRATIGPELLGTVPTAARALPAAAARDILLALITLKYTQSNSVCAVFRGQTIGIGAGQQSRIHCTQLAVQKAAAWVPAFPPGAARGPVPPRRAAPRPRYLEHAVRGRCRRYRRLLAAGAGGADAGAVVSGGAARVAGGAQGRGAGVGRVLPPSRQHRRGAPHRGALRGPARRLAARR